MPTLSKTRWLLVLWLLALISPTAYGQSVAKASAREARLSSSALQQIDALLQQTVERKQIAGAVALLAHDGKLGYLRAKGFQDVEAGKEMAADSLFRIASMSKPVTSIAVMILADDGRLQVTDPVSKYLPEFKNPKVLMPGPGGDSRLVPANREITIHDLLTHTSGLTYRFMAQKPFVELYSKADICDGLTRPPFTLAENVRRLASLPLLHQPGSAYQYSLSTDVLGRLVEVVSGQDLETFCRSRIFDPLGMNDTFFDLPAEKIGRLAVVYEPGPDKRIRRLGEEPVHKDQLIYCVTCPYRGQRGYCSGGAGLTASTADYARFLQMLLNGGQWNGVRILKPETVREITCNQIGDLKCMSPTDRFGYGFGIVAAASKDQPASVGSYSWGGFYNTGFWVDPRKKLVGVLMTQIFPSDHLTLYRDFMKLAYAAIQSADSETPDPAKAGILTAEQAVRVRRPSDVQFSPDGKRLAFTVNRPPKGATQGQEIWMLDVPTHRLWRFTHSPKSDRFPRWAPDGTRLAFLSDREERAQIYLIPSNGGEAEALTEGENAVASFAWSPDGKTIAFLAPEPKTEVEKKREKDKDDARVVDVHDKPIRLWVIEIATKKLRKLTEGSYNVESVHWAPKGDQLVVLASEHPRTLQTRTRIYTCTLTDGRMKQVCAPTGPVGNLQVSPDGTSLSFTSSRGDGPVPHDLFLMPVTGGEARNLTQASLDRPVGSATWQRTGRLLAVSSEGFRSRCLTIARDGTLQPLDGPEVNPVGPVAWSELGQLAFVGQTATELPEVYLMRTGCRAERVTGFNNSFRSVGLIKPEFFRFPSFDKTEIEGALYRPKGLAEGTRAPLFVHVHGGPTGAFGDSFDAWAQLLAARGYAVFCPNIRGSTGYGWSFLVKNRADWGGGDFKDVMAGVDHLIQRGIADPDRLAIGGWSYGGYMSAWAITQTPRFKASVVGACMSDLASEFGTEVIATAQYDRWFNGLPYERLDTYIKSSPVTHVKKVRTPTLILHGENDTTDPIGQAQQFYRGLKHYGVKCEFVIYPREGHGNREEKHQIDVLQRVVRWCDTHLKGVADPP